jgi:RimJ/RimL family protein N-acetyltransferase
MAFNEVGLEKLNCEVLDTNPAVVRLHKKFGFCEEGVRRANVIKAGRRVDVRLLGLLREEWSATKPTMQRVVARIGR